MKTLENTIVTNNKNGKEYFINLVTGDMAICRLVKNKKPFGRSYEKPVKEFNK